MLCGLFPGISPFFIIIQKKRRKNDENYFHNLVRFIYLYLCFL